MRSFFLALCRHSIETSSIANAPPRENRDALRDGFPGIALHNPRPSPYLHAIEQGELR